MYYINKIVGFVISPVGMAILAGLVAFACTLLKRSRAAKYICSLAAVWLWMWMTPIMTHVVGVPLEREFLVNGRVPMVETFPVADVIVLLGGGMGADTNRNSYAEMSTGADRVWQAARLYKAGKSTKVIATGFYPKDTTLPLLKDLGVAEDCISSLPAKNTEEEAKGIEKMGYNKILLVTSAWHMKRARLMFEKYAPKVEVVCAPADFEQSMMAGNIFSLRAILPDVNAFQLNSVAFHEWVGIVGYAFFR